MAAGPQVLTSNMACPFCDVALQREGKPAEAVHALKSRAGDLEMFCLSGHTFPDRHQLESLQPRKIEGMVFQPPTRPADACGPREALTVKVAPEVVTRLRSRFASNFDASIEGILTSMCCDSAFIVPANERQTLNTRARKPIGNIMDLLGVIDEIVTARDDLQKTVDLLKTATPATPGNAAVKSANMLELDEGLMTELRKKALASEQPLEKYLENVLSFGLSNGWF